jgi:2-oxoglutarate ferredoxin oxidoreductase subunit beta
MLEDGKPLLFGANRDKGIRMRSDFTPEVVEVGDGEGKVPVSEIVVHREKASAAYAFMLAHMDFPEFPVPMGILHAVDAPCYDEMTAAQIETAKDKKGPGDLKKLLYSGTTWEVS